MRIAGIMQLKYDPEKSMLGTSLQSLMNCCDEVFVLIDNPGLNHPPMPPGLTETLSVKTHSANGWSDWGNKMALLARASKYGCRWAFHLDDDETIEPGMNFSNVHALCELADAQGATAVEFPVRTVWKEGLWRTDGIFGRQTKYVLQINALMLRSPTFEHTPEERLHAYTTVSGPKMPTLRIITHWGLRTRSLREKNVARYESEDPDQKFSHVPYRYLLDEAGMELQPL
jgi:hypothetical protein